jgi:hypothetical protein
MRLGRKVSSDLRCAFFGIQELLVCGLYLLFFGPYIFEGW